MALIGKQIAKNFLNLRKEFDAKIHHKAKNNHKYKKLSTDTSKKIILQAEECIPELVVEIYQVENITIKTAKKNTKV